MNDIRQLLTRIRQWWRAMEERDRAARAVHKEMLDDEGGLW